MAAYIDLANITQEPGYSELTKKISVAVAIKAYSISQEASPTEVMIEWAKQALIHPDVKRQQIENYIFAENNGLTIAQILGATDTQIQSNVDSAVDDLLGK